MTINFGADDLNFNSDLYAMLTWFEDNVSDVYVDSRGYATIGVGFLVSRNANTILLNMGLPLSPDQIIAAAAAITAATNGVNFFIGLTGTPDEIQAAANQAAQNAINNALNQSTGNTGLNFVFNSDQQVKSTFNAIIGSYEPSTTGDGAQLILMCD
jgi:hypothetical protein